MSSLEKHSQEESLTWGEGYATYSNRSGSFKCINESCLCENDYVWMGLQKAVKFLVGIQKTPTELWKKGFEYAMIFECPECHTRFWYHASEEMAEQIKRIREGKTDKRK